MPWKGEKDPYKIWISEIILQQTRVQQGLAYYERFITAFPNIQSLAESREEKVFKLWEGLGYYSRCKNLIATAKYIWKELEGHFPEEYEEILALKGIGNYTASAISSFAFHQPYAVLDGNVFRVLSRFFGLKIPINTTAGKKLYSELAYQLLPAKQSAAYNQAIMDFGATICKPSLPECAICVMRKKCIAFQENLVSVLPINEKIIKQKRRFFDYFVLEFDDKFYIKKRTNQDIWQNLFEFYQIENSAEISEEETIKKFLKLSGLKKKDYSLQSISTIYQQKLTHQTIEGRFIHIVLKKEITFDTNYQLVDKKEMNSLAFPKFISTYLKEKESIFKFVLS
jgi:A/G-specific adenine glycosylase